MESKPLSFDDSETVLTYMEPNFRFNLALKIPLIRTAEKAASLIINRLELHDNRFLVNDTEYSVRVLRGCQAKIKSYGTKEYDFDNNVFEIDYDGRIQPGDIIFAELGTGCGTGSKSEEFKHVCHKKSSLPCNHFIHLIDSESTYMYMKMYVLVKRLLAFLFGNRNGKWTIENLNLKEKMLPWPANRRKPIALNVEIGDYSQLKLDTLQSIIGSSVPSTSLEMSFSFLYKSLSDHPILESAENVIISNDLSHPPHRALFDLFSIETQNVSITTEVPAAYHERLISKLMEKTRPIGVRYSILTGSKINLTTINRPEELEKSKDCIKLAMGSEAVAVVQYKAINSKTWLNMEIVSREI
ncbi:hypothetical protein B9Z55_000194 [Caenorhabditis nigoni]|uniref:DUF38 domain-containing protein n=1 Tax=Caenorhabditis nigoni TaxID=1611254 RepID=A0A2G5VI20_9PELO|nr:hypothetical protein B9Z55_000194 [Caenorhabditis nigoni]